MPSAPEIVGTWSGALEVEGGRVLRSEVAPMTVEALAERVQLRRKGLRTPEESALLVLMRGITAVSRDRRLVGESVTLLPPLAPRARAPPIPVDSRLRRQVFLRVAEEALAAAWDPSIHVEEAVRSMAELDSVKNLLGERLVSWGARDLSEDGDGGGEPAARMARSILQPAPGEPTGRAPTEPELTAARKALAALYESVARTRSDLELGIEGAMPRRAPNVTALLGPLLAARIISQAGGLERMARLPASTIQVLGAEKAFFEHLRGRAPPPRHGFLFLHPSIQGAPRRLRGKLARALAGKVAIAARLDAAGTALRPDLKTAFDARSQAVRSAPKTVRRPRGGSAAPLHRAAED